MLTQGDVCKKCGKCDSRVFDTRVRGSDCVRVRKRQCRNCGNVWKTVELYDDDVKEMCERVQNIGNKSIDTTFSGML